ncbi:hypothetical protein WJX73_002293 [Symbiochloris irregularis]|uniref:Uncharacterized protein n=1 Tax=Symbiochloris irregularis TaxID=706552 RepID=A0AAW1PUU5_9CHLO
MSGRNRQLEAEASAVAEMVTVEYIFKEVQATGTIQVNMMPPRDVGKSPYNQYSLLMPVNWVKLQCAADIRAASFSFKDAAKAQRRSEAVIYPMRTTDYVDDPHPFRFHNLRLPKPSPSKALVAYSVALSNRVPPTLEDGHLNVLFLVSLNADTPNNTLPPRIAAIPGLDSDLG